MKSEGLLEKLNVWDTDHGFHAVGLSVFSETQTDAADLEIAINDWVNDGCGWIARQSGVRALPREDDELANGHVVAAELTKNNETIQIRRCADGWIVTKLIETKCNSHLADEIVHLTVNDNAARYRRYWTLPDDGAAEIFAWRFIGFEEVT